MINCHSCCDGFSWCCVRRMVVVVVCDVFICIPILLLMVILRMNYSICEGQRIIFVSIEFTFTLYRYLDGHVCYVMNVMTILNCIFIYCPDIPVIPATSQEKVKQRMVKCQIPLTDANIANYKTGQTISARSIFHHKYSL